MTRIAIATMCALALMLGAGAIPATAASEHARPVAGQFCKAKDRGKVATYKGRSIRCTPEGSRSRWRYR